MRAWHGKRRLAKKLDSAYFTDALYKETLDYLLNAKPGDLIHACTGYNHRIQSIQCEWRVSPSTRTRIVIEVMVAEEGGYVHWFPGGGCVSLPETREAIEAYWRGWDTPEGRAILEKWKDTFGASGLNNIERLKRGEHIVDENGIRLS